jgi:long-subunit fatty acid transport protein
VGLPFVNFKEEKTYIEEDPDDEIPIFVASTFKENLSISGIGVNFKLGLIFRVNQTLRLGAAVHTPTAYNLTDNFSTELNYIFDVGNEPESFTGESPEGTFDYKLKSPWRYVGSAGVIIRKLGFLTAEIEYVDYSGAVFNLTANSSDPGDAAYQDEINQEISEDFTSALNFKLGGEYAYEMFRFRAGYGIYGTPYAEGKVVNHAISFGLGFRKERFYMDLAFRRLMIDEGYIPYTMSDMAKQQLVNNSINNDRIALTFGFKF